LRCEQPFHLVAIDQAVGAFIGLFAAKNIGKMVVKLAWAAAWENGCFAPLGTRRSNTGRVLPYRSSAGTSV
jgi:hypothetical protein